MKPTPQVFIGLGGNLGNRKSSLLSAVRAMNRAGIEVSDLSPLYETSPVGPKQRPFLNAVARVRTRLAPRALLSALQSIETALGRRRTYRWGPRRIDLDILAYGRRRLRGKRLSLPHPGIAARRFVLVPWSRIAPGYRPPGCGADVGRMARELTDPGQRVKLVCRLPSKAWRKSPSPPSWR